MSTYVHTGSRITVLSSQLYDSVFMTHAVWKSVTNVSAPLAGGYNVLLNVGYNGLSWYLDNTATDWMHVYLNEPCCAVSDGLCPMILGGHGEQWGETVLVTTFSVRFSVRFFETYRRSGGLSVCYSNWEIVSFRECVRACVRTQDQL